MSVRQSRGEVKRAKDEGDVFDLEDSVEHETHRPIPSQSKLEADDDLDDEEEGDVLPNAQPCHPRNEVDTKLSFFRENVLHVYGLDFLKTGHMDEIFSQFNHKFIEWINDSSANIIFPNATDAKRALEALSFPKAGDEPWRRTPDILVSEDMPPIFLQMRLACGADTKKTRKAMPSLTGGTFKQSTWRRYAGRGDRRGMMKLAEIDTKRPREPPTDEEIERRRKRATRFQEWLEDAVATSKGKAGAAEKNIDSVVEGEQSEAGPQRGKFCNEDSSHQGSEEPVRAN